MRRREASSRISQTAASQGAVPDVSPSPYATTPRPLIIYGLGTLLLIVNAWFGTYAYVVIQALVWTQTSLQRGPVVMLFALVLANLLFVRGLRRFAFTQGEMLILYTMLATGTCAGGCGFVQILINQMAAPFYFANGGNGFADRLQPNIAPYMSPTGKNVLDGFFRGNSSLWLPAHWQGWLVPVLFWSGFLIAIFWTLLCVSSLFRRSWVESERLTFPLVLLPVALSENGNGGALWRNRWMWIGFFVAGLLESLNFIGWLIPSIPMLPIKPTMGMNEIGVLLTSRPWSAVGRLTLAFYPFAIGIGYLLALDVSFSCWFLYLMGKVTLVACSALGLSDGQSASMTGRIPFIREQGAGAFIGLALFAVWAARSSLGQAWRSAFRRPNAALDTEELMPPRMAFVGGLAGLFLMMGFLVAMGFGVPLALLFVFVYVCFSVTLARIVSEAGAGWAWAPFWSPAQFTSETVGINHLSPKELTAIVAYASWTSDMRDNPAPHYMQGMKAAQQSDNCIVPRDFLRPVMFAIVIGVLAAFWAHLDIYYTYGAATAKVRPALVNSAQGAARNAVSLMVTPTFTDWAGMGGALFGAFNAIGLSLVRQGFAKFPLHPLGYALATTNSMEYMWCPFFVAWVAKSITLKYGGIRAYRAALPFFLGLILGDYVIPTLWGLFGMATDTQQYMVFPH